MKTTDAVHPPLSAAPSASSSDAASAIPRDTPSASTTDAARPPVARAGAVRACIFVLAGQPFAVGVDAARGVAVFEDTTPVPGAPAHVLGIANMRGRLVPLLDIRAHLGQAAPWRGRGGKALVIESDGVEVAIAIDDVFGLESFDAVHTLTGEDRARYRDFAVGQFSRSGRPVMLLDAAALIDRLRINRGDREGDATPRAAGKEAR